MTTSTSVSSVSSVSAAPAWDTYIAALKALELAEVSYDIYAFRDLGPDATDRDVRHAGQLTTLVHNALVNARRAVVEARRAYQLATDLESE
jgi:hypothetical protein